MPFKDRFRIQSISILRTSIMLLIIGVCIVLSACRSEKLTVPETTNSNLHAFTNSPARVVWVQDLLDNKDVSAVGSHLSLMGYDSEDGRGERVILAGPENFFRPLITPSGQQIVFSDFHKRRVETVDWSGENRQFLTKGRALAVWQDPLDDTEWVYVGRGQVNDSGLGSTHLYRVQLKNPKVEELLWDKAPFGDAVHISGDGRSFSAEVSGAACSLVDIDAREARRLGKGCWPAVSPDTTARFWFFDGAHRNLQMLNLSQGTRNRIYLADAPGVEGQEVFHPRWSNHPRYMVMTGPYTIRQGGNNIRGGGGGVEIYVGRFNKDFTKIEDWIQISSNQRADFFPDLWVANREQVPQEALNEQNVTPTGQPAIQQQKSTGDSSPILVKAKLVAASSIPTPEDILPYRQGLVVNEYHVLEVEQGEIQDKEILVAHWAIRDGKNLPKAKRTVGTVYELRLDLFDNRPELEGERLSMESDNLLLTMYYDLDS